MKIIRITATAILSLLLLGIAAPSYGQQEQQREKQGRPEQQQGKHEQAKPEQRQNAPRQQQQNQGKQQQQAQKQQQQNQDRQQQNAQRQQQQNQGKQQQQAQKQQQQNQNRQQQQAQQQQRGNEQHRPTQKKHRGQQRAWQQHRARSWQSDHRTWQQRGGYNGYRIPDDRFRGSFGPEHGFRIYGRPFGVVGGYPRFQYNGYWFSLIDPWPEYWADDWYDTDDVYVAYIDNGYYLFDRRYPNIGIAISISR